jgi:carboxymethylenebutenolidase
VTAERTISLESGASTQAYVVAPRGTPRVAALVLGEIWSVNANIRRICDRLAGEGCLVVAPDLYRGAGIPAERAPQEELTRSFEAFDDPRGIRDCRAAARWLRREFPSLERVVAWGFCMGGRFAHYVAAFGGAVDGVINCYGRVRFERTALKPFTPYEVAGLIEVHYFGIFAEHDPLIPLADVEALREHFASRGAPHELRVLRGTEHGFFNDTRPAYNPAAVESVWQDVVRFVQAG